MEKIESYRNLKTPFFVCDEQEFERSVIGFQKALSAFFSRSVVGYSVKTNSLPFIIQKANKLGAFAEVVSADEYELAIKCGYLPERIIYNGPMKSQETFLDAIIKGAVVNIEAKRELEWLKLLPNDKIFKVGIRLNINISKVSPEDAVGDNDNSRFGFSTLCSEFSDAIASIDELPNVKLAGLHIHRTAHSRSVDFYKNSLEFACELINQYGLQLEYLDIGGGYFGIFDNKPSYRQYSEAFYDVLRRYGFENLEILVEPGNALVASCFSFFTEVIDVKRVGRNEWFVTTDGSRNDVDPFYRKSSYLFDIDSQGGSNLVGEQVIAGCTCLENDRLFTLSGYPLLSLGDRIRYRNVGAYTMCLSPLFIRMFPDVYADNGKDITLVRKHWTSHEIMQNSNI